MVRTGVVAGCLLSAIVVLGIWLWPTPTQEGADDAGNTRKDVTLTTDDDKSNRSDSDTGDSDTGDSDTGDSDTGDSEHGRDNSSDEARRARIVGTWEDDYKGHRTFSVRADGTATMVVELKGMSARLYAKKMTFNETWRIEDGQLKMKMVNGEPANRVKLIIKSMGDYTEQKILELTHDRMHLLDANGKTKYDWRRVAEEGK